ncbi:MAG TPA: aminopeptidase, partial [Pyrinomonadaceae bacterium]|nr:aminopeptidase [Pyrinomonadaceae bacterium]
PNAPQTANNAATPAASASPETARKTAPTDLEQLAKRIVTQSANVREGDIVLIDGGARDLELLENIATDVQEVGGDPLVGIDSDRMTKKYFAEVPEKYDSAERKVQMALARLANVIITIDSNETEGLLADVPPARRAARAKSFQGVGDELRRRNVRTVEVGNELYPTAWRAKRFGMAQDEFARAFWDAVNVDYTSLQQAGDRARVALAGDEVHITHPNGTDLKVSIRGREAGVSDGIISPDDERKGAGNVNVFLPAGEVYVAPVVGTASGKFVIDQTYFEGKEVTGLTLTFEGGKLTSMTGAGAGFDALKADYDAAGEGKDIFGFVDIGINPNFRLSGASKLGNWISAGMVTVGTGNNTWAGGDNNSTGGVAGHQPGCTVTIDGRVVVENGTLKQ